MSFIRPIILSLLLLVPLELLAQGQTFQLAQSQVSLQLVAGYTPVPVRVGVLSNSPSFQISQLSVGSDQPWVIPNVDTNSGAVVLRFAVADLVALPSTATITAIQGGATNRVYVTGAFSQLNAVKLVRDPIRARAYAIHYNGVNPGALVTFDTVAGKPGVSVSLGRKPTDLVVSSDGSELLVMNAADKAIQAFDTETLTLRETILLPEFDDSGVDSTWSRLATGRDGILYYTDGAWAPVLRVLDRASRRVLQRVTIDSFGIGAFALTGDGKNLVAWAQYGWGAGSAASYLGRYTVDARGMLTFAEETPSTYPGPVMRDPLDTPVLINADDSLCFAKHLIVRPQSINAPGTALPGDIYSISPGGEVAITSSAIYLTKSGTRLYYLPVASTVQTVSIDFSRLVYFDASQKLLKSLNLIGAVGLGVFNLATTPANQAITLAPDRLTWGPVVGAQGFRVFLGTNSAAVAAADTNSALYLGQVNALQIPVSKAAAPGVTYYWRRDVVTNGGALLGDVQSFTVATISSSADHFDLVALQGFTGVTASATLQAANPGTPWLAVSSVPWILIPTNSGVTPSTLNIRVDTSLLPVGFTNGTVSLFSGSTLLFALPVSLKVEPLKLTVIKSDPSSKYAYAVSEDTSAATQAAYLLEINTESESIERMLPVGSGVTDLAVHNGDGRIYVTNWRLGQLLAVRKDTFQLDRTYSVAAFGGIGAGSADVYRIAAGAPGRLITEAMDQWIHISILDTVSGNNITNVFEREGGGATSPGGRYYYHGDDNISDASIHKLDLQGDHFTEVSAVRVSSVGYYGSRVVVVSEDGKRVFWNGSVLDQDLKEEWAIGDIIYACTPDGRYAFGQDKIYDVLLRRPVLAMPASTGVSAFNAKTRKVVAPVAGALGFFAVTDPPTLPTPVLLATTAAAGQVKLTWADRSLETSFNLQQRALGSTTWLDLVSLPANTNQYLVSGLLIGSRYEFRMRASASETSSDWSPTLTYLVPPPPPATPELSLSLVVSNRVVLTWNSGTGADRFVLERRNDPAAAFAAVATLAGTVSSYTDTAVAVGEHWEYRIRVVNDSGSSGYSPGRLATIPAPQPPATPTLLFVNGDLSSGLLIRWSPASDADAFIVQRRTEGSLGWSTIAVLDGGATSHLDTHLLANTEYWYQVYATNSIGGSGVSTSRSAVAADGYLLVSDNFNAGMNPRMWSRILGGVTVDGGSGFLGSPALWFGTNSVRLAETVALPVAAGTRIAFSIRVGGNALVDGAYWDAPEAGESVLLEYSKDGFVWTQLSSYELPGAGMAPWLAVSLSVPETASSPHTQFRWRQLRNSGAGFDTWALDSVSISSDLPPSLSAPPYIVAGVAGVSSITLRWGAAPGALAYVIERQVPGRDWILLNVVDGNDTAYLDTSVQAGKSYAYRIKAVNSILESDYSQSVSVATAGALEEWLLAQFGRTDIALEVPDADHLTPLERYAYHLASTGPASSVTEQAVTGLPRLWRDPESGRLQVQILRRDPAGRPGVEYRVQFSDDLRNWQTAETAQTTTQVDDTWQRVTFQDPSPTAPGSLRRFSRVVLALTP